MLLRHIKEQTRKVIIHYPNKPIRNYLLQQLEDKSEAQDAYMFYLQCLNMMHHANYFHTHSIHAMTPDTHSESDLNKN